MRNIKTILMVVLLMCLSLTVTLGLSSCKEAPHVHEFTKEVTLEATCTEAGELTFTCECGYSYTEETEAKGHTVQIDPAIPATCTEGGLTEGSHCFDCGLVFQVQMETKPLGHKPGPDATCTKGQVCENGCGMEFAPAIGHFIVTEATCTVGEICAICEEEVTPALGHSIVVKEGVEPGCFTTGLTEGQDCDRCHSVIVAQEIIPATGHIYVPTVTEPTCKAGGYTTYTCKCGLEYVADYTEIVTHDYVGEVTAPGCFEKGYTTYTCRFCHEASYVADYTAPTHIWEYYEAAKGFERHCTNGCDATESTSAPVADSYKASVSKNYVSERANEVIIRYGKYGAWGVLNCNGTYAAAPDVGTNAFPEHATMYSDIIRDFDKKDKYVTYEIYLEEDGYVDFIWHVASSAWNGSTNAGLADMAASMVITIDGKPVDISGLALPAGDGVNDPVWWNMHTFVVEGVALEAGAHTFRCVLTKNSAGLNIGHMEVRTNRAIDIRNPEVTKADIIVENDRVYYVLNIKNCNYTLDELSVFHDGGKTYKIVEYVVDENDNAVVKLDMTDWAVGAQFNPHMSFAGRNYVNNANWNGDVRGDNLEFTDHKYVTLNGKNYVIYNNWEMPSIMVYGKTMLNTAYDLVEEDGKPILLLTYLCLDYDPNTAKFFDGSKTLSYTVERKGAFVVYHIDLTKTVGANFYTHMSINGQKWNGKDGVASSNGDALAPGWTGGTGWSTQKTITVNGQVYVLGIQYKMIVIGH